MELQRVRRPEGPQDWEAQRAVITDLYITKGLELEHLMEIMEEDHFFKATKKQYKTNFTKWDLRKNIKPSEYNAIIKKKRKREDEGKDSIFRLRGAVVNDSKIVRYEKKAKKGVEHEVDEAGTPDDLSCFTPSPVASSPSAPSPVLPPFSFPNLVRGLIDSLISSSLKRLPIWGIELIMSLLECVASLDWVPLKLDMRSRKSEIMNDIIDTLANQTVKYLEIGTFFPPHRYGLVGCDVQQSPYFRMRQPALSSFLPIQPSLASTDFAIRKFFINLQISDITTTHDVGGGASALDVAVALMGIVSKLFMKVLERNWGVRRSVSCDSTWILDFFLPNLVVDWGKLVHEFSEQKHNPSVRRSKSCESIKSMESFLSDPVIDWKDLMYGYNR